MTTTVNPTAIEFLEEGLRTLAARPKPSDEDRDSLFAGLEPVVQGMLALARISTYVKITKGGGEGTPFPRQPSSSRMGALLNPEPEGCGCSLAGRSDLGPRGQLGIKAVMHHENGDVGLMLPHLAAEPDFLNLNAYVVVTIDPSGRAIGRLYRPYIHQGSYLGSFLGMSPLERAIMCNPATESLNSILRVPEPIDYLAVVLTRLGKYFEDLAEQLSASHRH